MYSLCVLATCLGYQIQSRYGFIVLALFLPVLANGWFLQHPKTRRDERPLDREPCAAEVHDLCYPDFFPGNRNDMFDNSGNLRLNCSEGALAHEKECIRLLTSCSSYPEPRIGFYMVIKAQICSRPDVFKSGRECWNELDSVNLSSCRHCGDLTCYRDAVNGSVCTAEDFMFVADLNCAVSKHISEHY